MFHRFMVTDFAHQNHVWGLAQGVFQGGVPVVGVEPDFALGHQAVLVRVHELDGVFNRDDVTIGLFIAPVHHGGQGGRFARAGCTDQDAQATLGGDHFLEDLRHAQAVNSGHGGRDHSHDHASLALLNKSVHPKAADAFWRDRKVTFLGSLKLGGLAFAHDGAYQFSRLLARQPVRGHFGQLAVDLHGGRKTCRDKQVAAFSAQHQLQQFSNKLAGLVRFHDGRARTV